MIKVKEAGMPTAEVCRKQGLCQGTFYNYNSKFGGMEVSDVAKMRSLEDENAKLKPLLADAMLDKPQQNAFIESFHGSLRDELLNEEIFDSLDDARRKLALWRYDDNNPFGTLLRNALPGSGRAALIAQEHDTRTSAPDA